MLLEVEGLTKHFPIKGSKLLVQAVNEVSFQISAGETLGLVGESGSGKTTVGRCVLRLIEPTGGSILVRGRDITHIGEKDLRQLRPDMQMVFQNPYDSLNPRMTAGHIIEEPLILWRTMTSEERQERVGALAGMVGVQSELLDLYPHQLSGGQQQRVAIARAIATDPALLILDEPTSALDPYAHNEIIKLLIELQRRLGIAYLFISHDLNAVKYVSHKVAIMYLSAIIEVGGRDEIFASPQHPYSRALLSSVLYPDPKVKRPRRYVLEGEIPSPIQMPRGCFLFSRCPVGLPECDKARPKLNDLEGGHAVACFRVVCKDSLGPFSYLEEGLGPRRGPIPSGARVPDDVAGDRP